MIEKQSESRSTPHFSYCLERIEYVSQMAAMVVTVLLTLDIFEPFWEIESSVSLRLYDDIKSICVLNE